MLNHVKSDIQSAIESDDTFLDMYNRYVCKVQDMDIENELLPLIKKESTEVVKFQKKLERSKKRSIRKMSFDFDF